MKRWKEAKQKQEEEAEAKKEALAELQPSFETGQQGEGEAAEAAEKSEEEQVIDTAVGKLQVQKDVKKDEKSRRRIQGKTKDAGAKPSQARGKQARKANRSSSLLTFTPAASQGLPAASSATGKALDGKSVMSRRTHTTAGLASDGRSTKPSPGQKKVAKANEWLDKLDAPNSSQES